MKTLRRFVDSSSAWCRRGIGYNTQHYPALLFPLTCKLRLIPHLSFLAADIFMIQLLDQIFIQCQKIQYPCLSVHYFIPGIVSTVAVHRNIKTLLIHFYVQCVKLDPFLTTSTYHIIPNKYKWDQWYWDICNNIICTLIHH